MVEYNTLSEIDVDSQYELIEDSTCRLLTHQEKTAMLVSILDKYKDELLASENLSLASIYRTHFKVLEVKDVGKNIIYEKYTELKKVTTDEQIKSEKTTC